MILWVLPYDSESHACDSWCFNLTSCLLIIPWLTIKSLSNQSSFPITLINVMFSAVEVGIFYFCYHDTLLLIGTNQTKSMCMCEAADEGSMYVRSVEFAARNPACWRNTFARTQTSGPMSASTVTLPLKRKVSHSCFPSSYPARIWLASWVLLGALVEQERLLESFWPGAKPLIGWNWSRFAKVRRINVPSHQVMWQTLVVGVCLPCCGMCFLFEINFQCD